MQVFGVIGPGSGRLVERIVDHTSDLAVIRGRTGDGARTAEAAGDVEGTAWRSGSSSVTRQSRERPSERSERGRESIEPPEDVGPTTYTLSAEGWAATGEGLTLEEALDRVAPEHACAVVVGFPEAAVPDVVLGAGTEYEGEELYGAPDPDAVDMDELFDRVGDLEPHETLESLVSEVKRSPSADRAGAIATFTGRVRAKDAPSDPPTEYLEFEKHEGVADRRMRAIEDELEEREGVYEVTIHHRTGIVPAGDDIVFVVVLAGHRREAFDTVEDGIDRLKEEVPLFKKEVTSEEVFWVHQRE